MNKKIEIYNQIKNMEEQRNELLKKLINVNANIKISKELCSHDIVFKLYKSKPYKIERFYTYYCPICDTLEEIYKEYTYNNKKLKQSKIIDLTNIQIDDISEVIELIHEEITNNIDFYYNESTTIETIKENVSNLIILNSQKRVYKK